MSQALRSYDRLKAANFSEEQARAILDAMAGDLVTREYLDARLEALEHRIVGQLTSGLSQLESSLTWRLLGIIGLAIVIVGLLDKFVRP